MSTVHKIAGGMLVSISTLATEFGMGRDTVSKRLERASIKPADKIKGSPVFRLRDAVKAILGVSGAGTSPDSADPEKLPPFERKAWYSGERERLAVAVDKGQLVPAADHEQALAEVIKKSVQAFQTMPDRLERECGLAPDVVERIVQACDQMAADYHADLLE